MYRFDKSWNPKEKISLSYQNARVGKSCCLSWKPELFGNWILMYHLSTIFVKSKSLITTIKFYENRFRSILWTNLCSEYFHYESPSYFAYNHCVKVSVFGVFLVRICPYLDWVRQNMENHSVFYLNERKYRPEKLRIRTLFTQWLLSKLINFY